MERPSSSVQNKFRKFVKMPREEAVGGESPEIVQVDIAVGGISDPLAQAGNQYGARS